MKENINTVVEIKLSYLEDTVQKLNKIVSSQQLELVTLQNKILEIEEKMEALDQENRPDRRPPHY